MKGRALTIYEDGKQTRDFVHVHDVVEANMLVLERDEADFQAFNVGSGNPLTVTSYAQAILKRLSTNVTLQIAGEYRRGDNRHSVSSIEKLRQLGWRPKRSLPVILDDFLAWIEGLGGIPEKVQDAYSHMRDAGVILASSS